VDDLLTIDEIESQYPSEWVLIGDPRTDGSPRLLAGRVLFHSPERNDVYRKVGELQLSYFAIRYLGEMPDGTALVLGAIRSTPHGGRSGSKPRFPGPRIDRTSGSCSTRGRRPA